MTSIRLALKRLRARPLLTVLLVIGLSLVVALPTAIPAYSDAAVSRVLTDQDFDDPGYRPPFSYLYWYSASLADPIGWEDVSEVDSFLMDEGFTSLGLPPETASSFFDTIRYGAHWGSEAQAVVRLATMSDLEDRVRLTQGTFPGDPDPSRPFDVLVHESRSRDLGVAVGDVLELADLEIDPDGPRAGPSVRVAGFWEEADPDDPYWIIDPDQLVNRLFTHRDVLTDILAAERPELLSTAAWFTVLDTATLSAGDADGILENSQQVTETALEMLPGLWLQVDPLDGFVEFQERSESLRRRLNAFALPAIGLTLLFVGLIVSLTTNERRSEFAVLRSRGASRKGLVGQVAVESILVTLASMVVGLAIGLGLASLMGRTVTFMDLSGDATGAVELSDPVWRAAFAAMGIALLLLVLPSWWASRDTVVTYAESSARATIKPWWQRTSLDLVVVAVVVALGFQFLNRSPDLSGDALDDPLLILFPALASLAAGLIILRVLPFAFEILARTLRWTPSVVGLVAARRAARSPGGMYVPLLLLVVTVSLAIFTGSLAQTLDLQLYDERYHEHGADWAVIEPHSVEKPEVQGVELPRILAPIEEFEEIDGVDIATRVISVGARLDTPTRRGVGVSFLGVEPDRFAEVAFYRDDYPLNASFPDEMARLEAIEDGVIVQPGLGLDEGDHVQLEILMKGGVLRRELVVVGFLQIVPTWYPDDAPFIMANLEPIFMESADPSLYSVWMRLEPGARTAPPDPLETDITFLREASPLIDVAEQQALPERQGVFGILTVGFAASILISILGFFFATLFKVRGSTVELGALQALGLTPRRVASIVVLELSMVMGGGLAAGVATGWVLSNQLIVRLVGDSGLVGMPPLLAEIDQMIIVGIIVLLLVLFVASAFALVSVLRRMRVFEALKLGEAP